MTEFYTFFGGTWNEVLVSGYSNGKKFHRRVPYTPFLFVPGKGDYRTIKGKSLDRVDFDSMQEARDFIKRYSEVANFSVFGFTNFPYVYIYENFKNQEVDKSLIKVGNFDIETDSQNGYGNTQLADREIITITLKQLGDKVIHTLGYKDYEIKEPELLEMKMQGYKFIHHKCANERELLLTFISLWKDYAFDAVTGWNIEGFDIPYIIKRIIITLSEAHAKELSPFGILNKRSIEMYGKEQDLFDIVGIATLDYMQVYKKFSFTNEESYSLNYISGKVLNATKLDYSEYKTLARLYNENYNKFLDYNVIDVWRVEQINNYLDYLDLVYTIAYYAQVNYVDSFTTVRVWDVMIHNYLLDQNIAIPGGTSESKLGQIAGGFVKEPQIGKHAAAMSFDFTSLYPKLIEMLNISPDTLMGSFDPIKTEMSGSYSGILPPGPSKILNGELDQYRQDMIDNNVCISGRGNVFTRDKQGFIPALMSDLFKQRKQYTVLEEEQDELLAKINAELHKRNINLD